MTPAQAGAEAATDAATTTDADAAEFRHEAFAGEHDMRLDEDTRELLLRSLLANFPDSPVTALREDGVVVDMPESIPLVRNRVLEARSALDLIVADQDSMDGWDRLLRDGAAQYPVHPVANPALTLRAYGLDLRERHGVILTLTMYNPEDMAQAGEPELEVPDVAPRFATLHKDQRSVIVQVDEAITRILGWSAGEMQGRRTLDFIHPDDHPLAIDNWMEMLARPGPARRVRLRHRRKDGSWVWFEITNHNLLGNPDHRCVVCEIVDISEEMAAHELVDRLAAAIPIGLLQMDTERNIVYTNERLHEILGVARAQTVLEQLASVLERDRPRLEQALARTLGEGLAEDIELELSVPGEDGEEARFCTVGLRAISAHDESITGAIACVTDVTEGARMRAELERRATFDELTGCYNRAAIVRALETDVAEGGEEAQRAVAFVDVDRFKAINDRYGHAAGDELLSVVARRLRSAVRGVDLVGRIGGDEFLVLCTDVESPQQALAMAGRLAQAQREEIAVDGLSISVQLSIGVAWSQGADADIDELVARADRAMYESKREHAGRPRLAEHAEQPRARRAQQPAARAPRRGRRSASRS